MMHEMITDAHFLRPWYLLLFIPWIVFCIYIVRMRSALSGWAAICNKALLKQLIIARSQKHRLQEAIFLFFIGFFMIVALSGPTWHRLKTPVYRQLIPHVLLLDMSDKRVSADARSPFLTRAIFALHDIFNASLQGQWALLAFTSKPFVISPLTQDARTIDALLPMIKPDIMPVQGYDLAKALEKASDLVHAAGYIRGQIILLTATPPMQADIAVARHIAEEGISVSVVPFVHSAEDVSVYQPLAKAGQGAVFPLSNNMLQLITWFKQHAIQNIFAQTKAGYVPLWRDEGQWFIFPALLLLLPYFQRARLQ